MHVFFMYSGIVGIKPDRVCACAQYSGVRLSFYTYYISPIEMGLLWAKITYLKTHSNALGFELQTDTK